MQLNRTTSPNRGSPDLCVERKLVEFEVFDECSGYATFLEDESSPLGVKHDGMPDRLSWLPDHIVNVQLRSPVLGPLDFARFLHSAVHR